MKSIIVSVLSKSRKGQRPRFEAAQREQQLAVSVLSKSRKGQRHNGGHHASVHPHAVSVLSKSRKGQRRRLGLRDGVHGFDVSVLSKSRKGQRPHSPKLLHDVCLSFSPLKVEEGSATGGEVEAYNAWAPFQSSQSRGRVSDCWCGFKSNEIRTQRFSPLKVEEGSATEPPSGCLLSRISVSVLSKSRKGQRPP